MRRKHRVLLVALAAAVLGIAAFADLLGFRTGLPREVPKFENVDARQIWRRVVERCVSVGCELAVEIENPGVQESVVDREAAPGVS